MPRRSLVVFPGVLSLILLQAASAQTPTITVVSPSPIGASTTAQQLTVTGTNFASGATVTYTDSRGHTFSDPATFVSSAQLIDTGFNDEGLPGIWTVTVTNPGAVNSTPFSFAVSATAPVPFTGTNGFGPNSLIQGKDGLFYGTAASGGSAAAYACQDGSGSAIGCCIDPFGNATGCGTVFQFNPSNGGSINVLYNFTGKSDGGSPTGLVQGGDGYLYGTTTQGGSSMGQGDCLGLDPANPGNSTALIDVGCGTIFRIAPSVTPAGQSIAPIYSFFGTAAESAKGAFPNPLVPGAGTAAGSTGSVFYGTSVGCDASSTVCTNQQGAVFSLTVPETGTAQVNTVYEFPFVRNSGTAPTSYRLAFPNALLQGSDGKLYGTAQLQGSPDCMVVMPDPTSPTFYGCGGAFVIDPVGGTEAETYFGPQTWPTASLVRPVDNLTLHGSSPRPEAIVRQPQHSFPSGGSPWAFTADPVTLAEASDGNIYGTTPPLCTDSLNVYAISTSCSTSSPNQPSMLFQLVPAASGATLQPPAVNPLYLFGAASNDGGGSLSGVTLGTDGRMYGSSGNVIFAAPPGNTIGSPAVYANLSNPYTGLVQGSDGNFYGVSLYSVSVGPTINPGAIFELSGPPGATGPVQLGFSANPVNVGSETTLTWTVSNALSLTAQQCYAFSQNGAPGASSWTGLQQGTPASKGWGGSLSITPTSAGSYTYALTCGGNESATATLTIVVPPLTLSSATLADGSVGAAYSTTLTATGGVTPYTWSLVSGSKLPSGLQLNASTGTISGTPTASGTVNFTVQVSDSQSTPAMATANFSITIAALPPLTITPASLPNGTVSRPYSGTLAATGGLKPYTWSVVPGSSLPGGLQLNASSGVISGTPTASGTFSFSVQVTDAESTPVSKTASLSMVVLQPLAIQAQTLPQGTTGTSYSATLTATGGISPYTWSVAPGSNLPGGLHLNASMGTISGTPTAGGTSSFTIVVADAQSVPATATSNFSIVITVPPPSVTANPTTVVITSPGGSGSTNLTFANFSGPTIAVSCAGTPSETSCTTSNATANSATLTIATTAPSMAAVVWPGAARFAWCLMVPGWALLLAGARRRRRLTYLAVLVLVVTALSGTGCGGGSSTPQRQSDPGTPAGSYPLTVTASSNGQSATVMVTLTVQ